MPGFLSGAGPARRAAGGRRRPVPLRQLNGQHVLAPVQTFFYRWQVEELWLNGTSARPQLAFNRSAATVTVWPLEVQPLTDLAAGEKITYRFAFDMRLGTGNYSVSLSLSRLDSHLDRNFEWRDYGLVFHVINNRREDFVGCSWLDAQASIQRGDGQPNASITSQATP